MVGPGDIVEKQCYAHQMRAAEELKDSTSVKAIKSRDSVVH